VAPHAHEMWSARHSIRRMPFGRALRLIVEEGSTVLWSVNDWGNTTKTDATQISALNLWLPISQRKTARTVQWSNSSSSGKKPNVTKAGIIPL